MKIGLLASAAVLIGATLAPTMVSAAQAPIVIRLHDIGGVGKGTQAYQGFKTAAKFWETHLTASQPTVIDINVGFGKLGPNILGSTRSSYTARAVQGVEGRLLTHGSTALDAKAAANLPGLKPGQLGVGALSMYTPGYTGVDAKGNPTGIDNATRVYDTDGSFNNSVIGLTTANAKALGYTFAKNQVDAQIQFSSEFAFDFNPKNGIDANSSDFIAVAAHEMFHALGFVSGVDDYDVLGTGGPLANTKVLPDGTLGKNYPANDDWFGTTFDLFRYSAPGALDWTTKTSSFFSLDGGATAYQNGLLSTGTYTGDSWQASHWKAPEVTLPDGSSAFSCRQPKLGIMNPYLCRGQNGIVTGLDLAAADAIGYNTTFDPNTFKQASDKFSSYVPEPAAWVLLIAGFGLVGTMQRRRRTDQLTA